MTDREAMKLALDALEEIYDAFKVKRDMAFYKEDYDEAIIALKERLAQPEPIQSLQCFHCQVTIETLNDKVMHLLAQRTWIGLTDDEIALINADYPHPQGFAKAIEAKLKEKNT
jgi:hypothetical protein